MNSGYYDVDSTCSKDMTDQMSLIEEVFPVSKNGISFNVYTNGYHATSTPEKAFDGDFETQYHTS